MKTANFLILLCALVISLVACKETNTTETTDSTVTMVDTGIAIPTETATTTAQSVTADADFAAKAAEGGMAEVEASRIATQKALHADVKKFAQKMVDDHGTVNDELKALAASRSMTLPSELNAEHQQMRDKLNTLSGADFDKEYMSGMVKDHDMTVALFESEANTGADADVKKWATDKLPTLRDHRQMAQDLAGKVGAPAVSAATP